ncbi:MAG: NAD(P)-dependent oxidoreductase [Sphingomonadaceae bacterium]|nr:NAD(P)-dependent oxidoreductase [Sphingomonadaceae bacterium]
MNLAITGGTGFVGQALIDRALARGCTVAALARQPQPPRDGVSWVRGTLADGAVLAAMMGEAEAVIHVAGVVNAPDLAGFEEGNVAGTLNMLEAAKQAGVPRFIFVSSLSAREPELSNYGGSKARAEQLVKASGLDWTIVRPAAIYGPRDREMVELFKAAKWGIVPTPAQGRLSVIHVEDLCELLLALVPGGEGVTGLSIEPDDGRPGGWTHYDFARAIGFAMGGRPKIIGLSEKTMKRAAKVDGFVRRKRAKLTADRAAYFSHPDWVVSGDARPAASLWQPRIETREGLKTTAKWYRENGWV